MANLKLTLNRQAFEVMVTGEKKWEFRKKSQWILSRLWKIVKKEGDATYYEHKEYEYVEFTNGYGKDKPFFKAKYLGKMENCEPFEVSYSNGLKVQVERTDQIIKLGEIVEIKNYGKN